MVYIHVKYTIPLVYNRERHLLVSTLSTFQQLSSDIQKIPATYRLLVGSQKKRRVSYGAASVADRAHKQWAEVCPPPIIVALLHALSPRLFLSPPFCKFLGDNQRREIEGKQGEAEECGGGGFVSAGPVTWSWTSWSNGQASINIGKSTHFHNCTVNILQHMWNYTPSEEQVYWEERSLFTVQVSTPHFFFLKICILEVFKTTRLPNLTLKEH